MSASTRIVHTNHPLLGSHASGDTTNSHARYDFAAERTKSLATQADIEAILADTSVPISIECRPGRGFSFGATSLDLALPPRMRVAPGPPHRTTYVQLSFDS